MVLTSAYLLSDLLYITVQFSTLLYTREQSYHVISAMSRYLNSNKHI